MLDERVKFLFKYWFQQGQSEQSYNLVVKFFHYYFCFNLLMANLSSKNYDKDMIKWLKSNNNLIKDTFNELLNSEPFLNSLRSLQKLSPISDNRAIKPKPDTVINDVTNFDEILDAIYQIRCNLFHGTKNPREKRDLKLMAYSTHILQKWIGAIYLSLF